MKEKMVLIGGGSSRHRISEKVFLPERPFVRNDPDRSTFYNQGDDTRYYRIGDKTYVADIYDNLMGIKEEKGKILAKSKNKGSSVRKTNRRIKHRPIL